MPDHYAYVARAGPSVDHIARIGIEVPSRSQFVVVAWYRLLAILRMPSAADSLWRPIRLYPF